MSEERNLIGTAQIEVDVAWNAVVSHPAEGEWGKMAPLRILSAGACRVWLCCVCVECCFVECNVCVYVCVSVWLCMCVSVPLCVYACVSVVLCVCVCFVLCVSITRTLGCRYCVFPLVVRVSGCCWVLSPPGQM